MISCDKMTRTSADICNIKAASITFQHSFEDSVVHFVIKVNATRVVEYILLIALILILKHFMLVSLSTRRTKLVCCLVTCRDHYVVLLVCIKEHESLVDPWQFLSIRW